MLLKIKSDMRHKNSSIYIPFYMSLFYSSGIQSQLCSVVLGVNLHIS